MGEGVLRQAVEAGVPGISAIVVDSSGVVEELAAGVRRVGTDDPITIDDMLHLGSNAKAMLATLTGLLVEDGRISWSESIVDAFTGLEDEILPGYRSVTVEMLLRHMGGCPPYTDDEADDFVLPDWLDRPGDLSVGRFARWLICHRPPAVEPGSSFLYSNAGYAVVAAMLEQAQNQGWRALLEENLFRPLRIRGMVGEGWPARRDDTQPWGHFVEDGEVTAHDPNGRYQLEPFLAPAGDISMAMPDYGRFLQLHLAGLRGSETLMRSATVRHLHNEGRPGPGLGWGITRLRSLEQLGLFSTHAGSAGTFVVAAAVSHEHDHAFAIGLNAGFADRIGDWLKAIVQRHIDA